VKAPSVRTPATGGFQPYQFALFVMSGRGLNGQVAWKADLTLEFLDLAGNPITRTTRVVDWSHPRFLLNGLPGPIAAFATRPGSQSYQSAQWHKIRIQFT
jgi:hypothetical protein